MADRTNTITTVYKVTTTDIKTATDLLNKADQASNKLMNDATAAGAKIGAAFAKSGQSLETLNARLLSLKEQITQSSDPTKVAALSAQYKALDTQVKQLTDDLFKQNKAVQDSSSAFKSASAGITSLYSGVKLLLTAGLVKELADAAIGAAKLGGQVEGVSRAFQKLPNAVQILTNLRNATQGTIDDLTLMQKALQAQNFGIPVEKLSKLLEFATVRAQQTGLSVDYLVNSIVTGLGRNSVKILDNLQIDIGELNKRVKDTGDTVQNVAIQMINESLLKMDSYVETSETKVLKLGAAWDNFIQIVSKKSAPFLSGVIDDFTNLIGGSKSERRQQTSNTTAQGYADAFTNRPKNASQIDDEIENEKRLIAIRNQSIQAVQKEQDLKFGGLRSKRGYYDDLETEKTKLASVNQTALAYIAILEQIKIKQNAANSEEKESVGILQGLKDQREKLGESLSGATSDSGVKSINAQISEVDRLIDVYTNLGKAEKEYINVEETKEATVKRANDFLEDYAKKLNDSLKKNDWGNPTMPAALKARGNQASGGGPNPQAQFNAGYNSYKNFWDRVADGFDSLGQRIRKGNEITVEDQRRAYQQLAQNTVSTLINIGTELAQADAQREASDFADRIDKAKAFYDNQIQLAGDNSDLKKKIQDKENKELAVLEKQRAESAKKSALTGIVINTALAVAKALASSFFPVNIAEAALVATAGAVQYSIASRAKYKDGVIGLKGPGTETSDDIPAMLSKGESVMTARETRESMMILKSIRSGKLNDQMLARIIDHNGGSQAKIDFAPVVAAINAQVFPSVEEHAGILYSVMKKADGSKKITRSKYGFF